ncbi:MAG: flavodoxin domain-containing protein [Chloroflexota bacterium]
MNILIAYASPHGSTAEVATFIGRVLNAYEVTVTVRHVDSVASIEGYDAFILGSAIHSSMWLPSLSRFMFRFEETLAEKSTFLFLTCLITLEEGGAERAAREFIWQEAIDKLQIPNDNIKAFAGKINWAIISGDEHWIIKGTYKGQKITEITTGDYRNWQAIAKWSHDVADALQLSVRVSDEAAPQIDVVQKIKYETITKEGVAQLAWAENPGEVGAI